MESSKSEIQSTLSLPGLKITLVQSNMIKETTDAIVNTANEDLQHLGGLAGAIVEAGGNSIQEESDKIIKEKKKIETGTCCITKAGTLKCKYVIHAVGPIYHCYEKEEDARKKLKEAIKSVFLLANQKRLKSISLPALSSGIFGYPKDLCAKDIIDELTRIQKVEKKTKRMLLTLKNVRIVTTNNETVEVFKKEMEARKLKKKEVKK